MEDIMKKFVRSLDPKLERYRDKPEPKKEPENSPPTYSPKTLKDFLQIIKNTPFSVLSEEDRATIASSISFRERRVASIMLPKDKITFVYEHDFLGPLMLDQLYKSGYSHFPVLSSDGRQIVGVLHTETLNSLEIRTTERAAKFIDKKVYYLRSDYTLEKAMAAFLRTGSPFFVVVNKQGQVVGLLTYKMLISGLLGYVPTDEFNSDSSLMSVMKR